MLKNKGFFMHFFKNSACFYYLSMVIWLYNLKGNTMNTFFSFTTILAAILAVGSIEDCGGHCLGNENWTMFFICLTITIFSGIMTLYTMKGNQ